MNDQTYDIVCAECGEEAEVPFEPAEDEPVYCQACYGAQRREIVCAACGEEAEVPFEPDEDEPVYCRSCYEEAQKKRRQQREQNSPRKKHNTRVACRITCAECGGEEELDYVPKGVSIEDALCSSCLREEQGEDSRWADIHERKQMERKTEWSFVCDRCGDRGYLNFPPEDGEDYYCTSCYNNREEPNSERLDDMESIGRGVYVPGSNDG